MSIEVSRKHGCAANQWRKLYVVNRVSVTMNSGLVVDVDQSRSSDLPTICRLPKVKAPHLWNIQQVSLFLEQVSIQCVIPDD
jgi:hypothetical protein